MNVAIDKIVGDVKVAIDHNMADTGLLDTDDVDTLELNADDVDTLELDAIVRSKILEGVRLIHMDAPSYLLEGIKAEGVTPSFFAGSTTSGYIDLPADFMRLVRFQMTSWKRKVFSAIAEDQPRYSLLSSKYPGVSGTAERPAAAIVPGGDGLQLEFYGSESVKDTIKELIYMPLPKIEADTVDISKRCYEAAVYRIAALTLATLNSEQSGTMAELSKALLT